MYYHPRPGRQRPRIPGRGFSVDQRARLTQETPQQRELPCRACIYGGGDIKNKVPMRLKTGAVRVFRVFVQCWQWTDSLPCLLCSPYSNSVLYSVEP